MNDSENKAVAEPVTEAVKLNLGWVVIIALLTLILGTMLGLNMKAQSSQAPSQPNAVAPTQAQPDVEALKAQVAQLTRFAEETAPIVINMGKRMDEVAGNHNKLVEAVQKVDSQKAYEISLMGRALRNSFGKDKWEGMLTKANKEFTDEANALTNKVEAVPAKPAVAPAKPAETPKK